MENTLSTRIADFLKQYPPFNIMQAQALKTLAASSEVQYFEAGQEVFRQGDSPSDRIYLVQQGAVQLLRNEGEEELLVDKCDEGDLFGLRPLLAGRSYILTAKAIEESLLYAIKTEAFKNIMQQDPKVAFYMASQFAADNRPAFGDERRALYRAGKPATQEDFDLIEIQPILSTNRPPVTCSAGTSIKDAALHMSTQAVGSVIVVNEHQHPIGIVTDKDLRSKVATGRFSLDASVNEIMSSPVITASPGLSVAEVQIMLLKHKINHICITENGTPDTPITGVLSEHDLLVLQANNPAVLIRDINRSNTGQRLFELRNKAEQLLFRYLSQEVSITYIAQIISEINDALIVRALQLAETDMKAQGVNIPEVAWCWLALGSEGRREQLLRTDQDNALIFADVPEAELAGVKAYFLAFAKKVNQLLNDAGFEFCPADMMAGNPEWCMSLSQWKRQFGKWIYEPGEKELMFVSIFFDYRPIWGDTELANALTQSIYHDISRQQIFLPHLAKSALNNPPPLSFFRNFIVEKDGAHKDEFDIKLRAMMPLADAARVLILEKELSGFNNTFRRFRKLAELEEQNRELYEQAADAYEIVMRYRALQGLKNKNSGRYFKPDELDKMDRMLLRNCFQPISDLQQLLSVRFRLNYIL